MLTLGVLAADNKSAIFDVALSQPTRPAARRTVAQSVSHAATLPGSKALADSIRSVMLEEFKLELERALYAVTKQRTTTSLVRLAQAYEACAQTIEAVETATDALNLASEMQGPAEWDVFGIRIALEILSRSNELGAVEHYASTLPIDDTTRLVLGASFAELGKYSVAHQLFEPVDLDSKAAALAYLLLKQGEDGLAIPLLRRALRAVPNDAESAHNLSIAFARSGAHRKALAAALRATRANSARQDISLNYLELLLQGGDPSKVLQEADRLLRTGVQVTPKLMVMQARAALLLGQTERGETLLAGAVKQINPEKDPAGFAEIQSNLLRIRVLTGHARQATAIEQLVALNVRFPEYSIIVSNLAQACDQSHHAPALLKAFERSQANMPETRGAYISFQIAQLQGDNEKAANHAAQWAALEPNNPRAISSAMVALGIGMERWNDALPLAESVLSSEEVDTALINNAAYIYAMSGHGEEAVRILTPFAQVDSTLKATLGLAYLSVGNLSEGFRLYREAASSSAARDHVFLSLITMYQALVVRQLGLDQQTDETRLAAMSLAPVSLPEKWQQRPEFLRLRWVANRHNFPWPMSL